MNDTVSDTRIVRLARFQPASTAGRSALPSRTSSRNRSKNTTNESAVMPMATIRPAIPDSSRAKFWYLVSSITASTASPPAITRLNTDTRPRPR